MTSRATNRVLQKVENYELGDIWNAIVKVCNSGVSQVILILLNISSDDGKTLENVKYSS